MSYKIIFLLAALVLYTSCIRINGENKTGSEVLIHASCNDIRECVITIKANDCIYYAAEGWVNNSYYIIQQNGSVVYQSNYPKAYENDTVVVAPISTSNIRHELNLRYLPEGNIDTLYTINVCDLKAFNLPNLSKPFGIIISQDIYVRTRRNALKKVRILKEEQGWYIREICD